jgi:hypothetical protein
MTDRHDRDRQIGQKNVEEMSRQQEQQMHREEQQQEQKRQQQLQQQQEQQQQQQQQKQAVSIPTPVVDEKCPTASVEEVVKQRQHEQRLMDKGTENPSQSRVEHEPLSVVRTRDLVTNDR